MNGCLGKCNGSWAPKRAVYAGSDPGGPCAADMLAGLVFDALRPTEPPHIDRAVLTSKSAKLQRQVRLISRVSAGRTILAQAWSLSQEEVVQSFYTIGLRGSSFR